MGWTVACFCGNLYTAPPDECNVCHKNFDQGGPQATTSAAVTQSFIATVLVADQRSPEGHSVQGPKRHPGSSLRESQKGDNVSAESHLAGPARSTP
jgi:hypothetical protein